MSKKDQIIFYGLPALVILGFVIYISLAGTNRSEESIFVNCLDTPNHEVCLSPPEDADGETEFTDELEE